MKTIIDEDALMSYGKKIIENADKIDVQTNRLVSIIEEINSIWQGADALKYIGLMQEKYLPKLRTLKSSLDDYGEFLMHVGNVYETLDETFAEEHIDI